MSGKISVGFHKEVAHVPIIVRPHVTVQFRPCWEKFCKHTEINTLEDTTISNDPCAYEYDVHAFLTWTLDGGSLKAYMSRKKVLKGYYVQRGSWVGFRPILGTCFCQIKCLHCLLPKPIVKCYNIIHFW